MIRWRTVQQQIGAVSNSTSQFVRIILTSIFARFGRNAEPRTITRSNKSAARFWRNSVPSVAQYPPPNYSGLGAKNTMADAEINRPLHV